ncbi:MAG: hypothetical protein ACUVWO_09150 [Thermodesulfobacteriota bacterium]
MSEETIQVMAYSGYRGEETPKDFILSGRRIEVVGVQKRWIEEGIADRSTKRFFQVKGDDGEIRKIFYDEERKEWYLRL